MNQSVFLNSAMRAEPWQRNRIIKAFRDQDFLQVVLHTSMILSYEPMGKRLVARTAKYASAMKESRSSKPQRSE